MRNKAGRFSGKCWWSSGFGFSSDSLRYHTWELLSTVQRHRKNRVLLLTMLDFLSIYLLQNDSSPGSTDLWLSLGFRLHFEVEQPLLA
ncbi:hypothetical protein EYF80_043454 [Liparis tanakae]|uniref:Uncharacterized protein n=1 Tax=Liparis tanakae TaxID=230148 RepID=A0A4Z2FYG7_9TELE|nr:hypothetical protein EYF80_043454 [Liparis tanakae]